MLQDCHSEPLLRSGPLLCSEPLLCHSGPPLCHSERSEESYANRKISPVGRNDIMAKVEMTQRRKNRRDRNENSK
jgi:hypothetical protein